MRLYLPYPRGSVAGGAYAWGAAACCKPAPGEVQRGPALEARHARGAEKPDPERLQRPMRMTWLEKRMRP
jgi:hypothetical protein